MREGRPASEAGSRPACPCHAIPMRWNKRRDLTEGGYWRCNERYKAGAKAWREANRESRRAYMLRWRLANPRQRAAYMRLYRYGIAPETYDRLMVEQDGRCALCGVPDDKAPRGGLHVDHDHITNRVRGLLCIRCNAALERVELPGWATRAAAYLT